MTTHTITNRRYACNGQQAKLSEYGSSNPTCKKCQALLTPDDNDSPVLESIIESVLETALEIALDPSSPDYSGGGGSSGGGGASGDW